MLKSAFLSKYKFNLFDLIILQCIPASMGIEPVPIKFYGDPDADKKFKKTVS